jgi:protein TonB
MRVLLVDHDSEGLESIARAIRGVLELDCVTSKGDAMLLLRQNAYDVLIACERCVDGSGLDLLGRTTRTAAPLKRIFAAPPDRLQLLGPRLAPFKVQRTISYPIDLEELWLAIAQVTGTNDETDGTIERVVLDERGIPSNGTTPRAPIPPRPPAPLREVRPAVAAPPAPAVAAAAGAVRTATARVAVAAAEPAVRAPPPPPPRPAPPATTSETGRMRSLAAQPATPSDTGRMRSLAAQPVAPSDTGRMRALAAQPAPAREEPSWITETADDDFAQVAAQARLGVQTKVVDEAARRKRQKLFTAGAVATAVAGVLVFLIEKFYDPAARAKEAAIAADVTRMAEQQKVTEDLMLIEIDIEKAIMDNNLDVARLELARLVQQSPEHPRREFLQNSIDRAAELSKLSAQNGSAESRDTTGGAPAERNEPAARPRAAERTPDRVADRAPSRDRTPERTSVRADREAAPAQRQASARSFGAPIGEAPGQRTIPLDAPINSEPTLAPTRRTDNSFAGRTIEASDSAVGRNSPNAASVPASPNNAGSAVATPPVAPAQAAVDVTPAKVVRRVAPVAPAGVPLKTAGFVVVKFNITENGRVADVEVVESSPTGVFDSAAQSAVRKWVYEPRKENGVAVSSSAKARLVFEPAN